MAPIDEPDAVLDARTQAIYRQANESVKKISAALGGVAPLREWTCECADENCTSRIALTSDEYERIRSDPSHFAVAPGTEHVVPEIENVIERHAAYWVVEKLGTAAEVTVSADPRAQVSSG